MMQAVQYIKQYNQHRVGAAGSAGSSEPKNTTLCSAINFKSQTEKSKSFATTYDIKVLTGPQ